MQPRDSLVAELVQPPFELSRVLERDLPLVQGGFDHFPMCLNRRQQPLVTLQRGLRQVQVQVGPLDGDDSFLQSGPRLNVQGRGHILHGPHDDGHRAGHDLDQLAARGDGLKRLLDHRDAEHAP